MPTTQLRSCELRYFPDLCWADHLSLVRPRDAHLGWRVARKCLIPGASTGVSTGGRLPRPKGVRNRARQQVAWVPPTAPVRAPNDAPERRARTTAITIRTVAPNSSAEQ